MLHAIARTLRPDSAERDHLFRLAEVPRTQADPEGPASPPAGVDAILNALDPLPAMLVNDRTDILAWNKTYGALRPGLVSAPHGERNTIWSLFTTSATEPAPEAVAIFRYRYSQHLNDPRWRNFVARLCVASPLFARLWATQDVAPPRLCEKRYDIPGVGEVTPRATGMDLSDYPGLRIIVYTPADDHSRQHLDQLI